MSRRTLILPFLNALELMSSYANQTWNILKMKQKHKIEKIYFSVRKFFDILLCFCLIDTELQKGFNVFRTIDIEILFLAILQTIIQLTSFSIRTSGRSLPSWLPNFKESFDTYLKLLNHFTTCAFVFLSNRISGKLCSMTLLSGYLVHKNINFAFLKCIGDNSELW